MMYILHGGVLILSNSGDFNFLIHAMDVEWFRKGKAIVWKLNGLMRMGR